MTVVRGDVRDQALLERVLGEYEIDTVIHLAAQTIVGDREPQSGRRRSRPTSAAPGRARGVPAQPDGQADRRRVVRQGLRRPASELPYDEETPLQGRPPLRCQQVVRRPDRADLRDDLRAAGGDHALRQFLRRRRSELEPHRARHDPLGPARRAAGHPLATASTSATISTSKTARRPTAAGRELAADPALRGEAFNFSNEMQVTVSSSSTASSR